MMFQMLSTAALVLLASNAALAIPQGYGGGGYGGGGYGGGGGRGGPSWHKRSDDLPNAWNTSSKRVYGHNSFSKWGSSPINIWS